MATIDHVTLRVGDLDASLELFSQSFELLDFGGRRFDGERFHEWNDFSVAAADDGHPPTGGSHIGFAATSRAQVDGWWEALTTTGYRDDGAPGPRPEYRPTYYGDRSSRIRVTDLAATERFYAAIAEATGARVRDRDDRLQVITESGTFSLLAGRPTRNLHLALGVGDEERVKAFHHAGLLAGGRDNGGPGERPEYHPGYYGAYLLDPDGNNVEAVWHNRSA